LALFGLLEVDVIVDYFVNIFGEKVFWQLKQGSNSLYFGCIHGFLGFFNILFAVLEGAKDLQLVSFANHLLNLEDVHKGARHTHLYLAVQLFLSGAKVTLRFV
jgi:hypothetical protein